MKFIPLLCLLFSSLGALLLENEVASDLRLLGLPSWSSEAELEEVLDVAIIGGGQAGLSLCLALYQQEVLNVALFDQSPEGFEGPWLTTARMKTLRTHKYMAGPAMGIPHLTFRAWYEAGGGSWKELYKIPTPLWGEYLQWYRRVLSLPVKNEWKLESITPEESLFKLVFKGERVVRARKVVLATGMEGAGGLNLPDCAKTLPREVWYHTGEAIPPSRFKGKSVGVVGAGASAFDSARVALEAGADKVALLVRRAQVPVSTPFSSIDYWPAFYYESDEARSLLFKSGFEIGVPPPEESVELLKGYDNFFVCPNTSLSELSYEDEIRVGSMRFDLLVFATGYLVDLKQVPELRGLSDKILLWGDRLPHLPSPYKEYPYLGERFQFLEKEKGTLPCLKNLHCFNAGALLSHGFLVLNIEGLPAASARLAEGIAIDLYLERVDRAE